jgi:hypothetical protein
LLPCLLFPGVFFFCLFVLICCYYSLLSSGDILQTIGLWYHACFMRRPFSSFVKVLLNYSLKSSLVIFHLIYTLITCGCLTGKTKELLSLLWVKEDMWAQKTGQKQETEKRELNFIYHIWNTIA